VSDHPAELIVGYLIEFNPGQDRARIQPGRTLRWEYGLRPDLLAVTQMSRLGRYILLRGLTFCCED